jgi:tetratricopeptide (TPR) repeat protein
MKERHSILKIKVEEYKHKKTKKLFRKQKFDNWIKTEAIVKSDKFSNYQKWELYESSSDEEEKGEPIVPRHDPNFQALERDLMESVKKKEISRNKSIKLKDEGNAMMKEGRYKKAISLYTEAVEETRGMMVLYTNRALAYIKVEDYHVITINIECTI